MTYREAFFVYPLLNTLVRHPKLSPERQAFLAPFLAKVKVAVDQISTTQESLIIKHGQRQGPLEKFKLVTKEQNDRAKAEMKVFRDGVVDLKLTKEEQTLFDSLYYQAVLAGYEDYPQV